MKETTLYIKIDRNTVVQSPKVLLSDIAKIECERQDILRKVKNLVVYNFESAKTKQHYHSAVAMSILKVIEDIHEVSSGSLIVNEGESDFVITYQGEQKQKKWLEKGKIIVLCVIVFFGSAFSINAFNNDVNIINVFNQIA